MQREIDQLSYIIDYFSGSAEIGCLFLLNSTSHLANLPCCPTQSKFPKSFMLIHLSLECSFESIIMSPCPPCLISHSKKVTSNKLPSASNFSSPKRLNGTTPKPVSSNASLSIASSKVSPSSTLPPIISHLPENGLLFDLFPTRTDLLASSKITPTTTFTVSANLSSSILLSIFELRRGIEPLHRGFADPSVSTSPPQQLSHHLLALRNFM